MYTPKHTHTHKQTQTWNEVVRSMTTPSSSRLLSLVRSTTEASEGVLDPEPIEMGLREPRLSEGTTTIRSSSLSPSRDDLKENQLYYTSYQNFHSLLIMGVHVF